MSMSITTIIPTIGRSTLSTAIRSVLDQGLKPDEFEIIVVNDSGSPLLDAEWRKLESIKVIETNRRNRSVARNVGAAAAKGKYLHFLDDDDWMLPGALETLKDVAESSNAAWTYGAFRLVDNDGLMVAELFPDETGNCSIQMMAWEWLPLQASLIRSDAFFQVDGFASLASLGGGFEDVHLSRQISLYQNMARTDQIVATIRVGDVSSTTDYVTIFDQNRRSREKTISARHALHRLIDSARSNPSRSDYWFGKVTITLWLPSDGIFRTNNICARRESRCTLARRIYPGRTPTLFVRILARGDPPTLSAHGSGTSGSGCGPFICQQPPCHERGKGKFKTLGFSHVLFCDRSNDRSFLPGTCTRKCATAGAA
jgi:glycosyltransferase involved in cell wall biosynthesis